ncbi:hypothetical protein GJU40_07160 [Bacillus lacus]|uniref:TerB-C domain-containing protein n=1 Tax=Metabacillus lacus TaxID=1983721 RepID=A0A7X2IYC9_9BACI|nr:TerB N-terminal domain-containing protein [Metabacillus lacus]MRX71951.1 hypothetical protein [Metabacillus lacus]
MFFKKLFNRDKKDNKKVETIVAEPMHNKTPPQLSVSAPIMAKKNPEKKQSEKKHEKLFSYNEESIYLDEFKHIKTTPKILKMLEDIMEPPKREVANGISVTITFDVSEKNFVKDSIRFSNMTHHQCEMPPFHTYYSKFADMKKEQKNWYFYWREQVLNGHYLPTDLSYIYVFVYELINYSFNQNAAFNLSMLYRLYEAYRGQHHIERFISLIGDMLYELGEYRLAEKWSPNIPSIPPLYKQLKEKHDDLSRISITYWKSYLFSFRESKFYTENKNKIYKTFKECLPLLEASHVKRDNKKLIDLYFEKREDMQQRWLFPGMVSIRGGNNFIQFKIDNIYPTPLLHQEVVAFFKLSENVTRLMNGEKRQLQVDENIFPPELKEEMITFLSRPKEKGRFKTVKTKSKEKQGGLIPPKPEDKPKVVIEFNDDRIRQLKAETDNLVDEVERRAQEHLENEEDTNTPTNEKQEEVGEKPSNEETKPDKEKDGLYKFFTTSGDDADEEQVENFLGELTDIEREFIQHFTDMEWTKAEATQFLKSKGQMLGVLLSSINEKAQESLEDNFLEEDGDTILIFEEFESVVNRIKER